MRVLFCIILIKCLVNRTTQSVKVASECTIRAV